MAAHQAIHQPKRRNYEATSHDTLILGLGEELEALCLEYKWLDDVAHETKNDVTRIYAKSEHNRAYDKMHDIYSTIAALKATSLESAAIQMRVICNYSTMDNDDVEAKMQALIFSVLGVLEGHGGFGRDQWAGEFYLGSHDPFDRIEA